MKKLTHLFLLCTYVLFANAADIKSGVPGDADNLEAMAPRIPTKHNVTLQEQSSVADTPNQVQNGIELPLIDHSGSRESESSRGDGNIAAKKSPIKAVPTKKPSYFNPFDDYKEESSYIFSEHAPDPDQNPKLGFSPLHESKEFILSMEIIDDPVAVNEALQEVVDNTVTMTLKINDAWNTLDEKVTHMVYVGVRKLSYNFPGSSWFNQAGFSGQSSNGSADDSKYKPPGDYVESFVQQPVSKVSIEPEGFFHYFLFHLPKMMTLSSLFIIVGVLYVMNLVYRVMRFFLLRI